MRYTKELEAIKYLIAQFQEETKSNSILDFTTWLENYLIKREEDEKAVRSLMNYKRG